MPSLLSPTERRQAAADRELTRRRRAQLGRYLKQPDLSTAQQAEAVAQLDAVDREAAMLETLLAEQPPTDWTMSRFAGPDDSLSERPYQEVAP